MDELHDAILELESKIAEWEATEDFFDGDRTYQDWCSQLSEMNAEYDVMFEEWSKKYYEKS